MVQEFFDFSNKFLANVVQLLLAVGIVALSVYLRRFMKAQKQRDEERDRRDDQLEHVLRDLSPSVNYFEIEKLTAYKKIRASAQKARDKARLIEDKDQIDSYDSWIRELFNSYEQILELLHENALLLEHFRHYDYVHSFKNVLLDFCLAARKYNPEQKEGYHDLLGKLKGFSESYEVLRDNLRFSSDSPDLSNIAKMSN